MKYTDQLNTPLFKGDTVILSSYSRNRSYLTIGIIVELAGNFCSIKTFKNNLRNQRIGTQTLRLNPGTKRFNLIKYKLPFDELTSNELDRMNRIMKKFILN